MCHTYFEFATNAPCRHIGDATGVMRVTFGMIGIFKVAEEPQIRRVRCKVVEVSLIGRCPTGWMTKNDAELESTSGGHEAGLEMKRSVQNIITHPAGKWGYISSPTHRC